MLSRGANFCGKIGHIPWYHASLLKCNRSFSRVCRCLFDYCVYLSYFMFSIAIKNGWAGKTSPCCYRQYTKQATREKNELYTYNSQDTGDQRPARRTLAFQGKGSPLQQVVYNDISRSFVNLKNTNLTEFHFLGKSKTSPKSKTCSFGQKP